MFTCPRGTIMDPDDPTVEMGETMAGASPSDGDFAGSGALELAVQV
jgi:hypothetical protein